MSIARGLIWFSCLVCAGCAKDERPTPTEVPSSAEPTAEAFVQLGAVAVSVGAPLATGGDRIGDDEAAAKDGVEDGLGAGGGTDGPAAVEDPTCISVTWQGLSAAIVFTDCVDDQTGEIIDGSVSLAMTLVPVTLSASFGALSVGATTFDGAITLSFSGTAGARQATLSGDLAVAGASRSIAVEAMSVQVSAGEVVLDGTGTATNPDVSFEARAVSWQGECLPQSGELDYDDGTFLMTIGFLPQTPSTGEVEISSGPFMTTTALLPPCP